MVTKKLFALASVTALTGLIATVAASGCSSTTIAEGPVAETGSPDVKTSPKEASVIPDDAPSSTECKGAIAVDVSMLPWKAPNIATGACSEKELADFVKYIDANQNAKFADWKKSVANMACSDCIFGKEADPKWKPLLEDAKGQLIEIDVGGCIQIASGKEACGKAYQNWFDCRFEACNDCPQGDTAALQKCLGAASKSACKKAFDDVSTVCGDTTVADAETACNGDKFVFEGPIRAQCIGFTDGG